MAIKAIKQAEYYLFTQWIATPRSIRVPTNQKEFSDVYKVGHDTLARWKKDPNFKDDVSRFIRDWTYEHTSDVLYSLFQQTQKGNVKAIKLWLNRMDLQESISSAKNKPLVEQTLTSVLLARAKAHKTKLTDKDIIVDTT